MKPLRGKRVGSAQSARGIQPRRARVGRPVLGGSPRWDLSPALAAPRRAHFLRGGAPRPALGRLGRVWGRRWLAAPAASFTAPPSPRLRRFPGPWTRVLAAPSRFPPALGRGFPGRGPLAPGATVSPGGLSSVRPNRVASPGRGPAHVQQASGVSGDVGNPPDPS